MIDSVKTGVKTEKSTVFVCVFCASSDHVSDIYNHTARILGLEIVSRGMTLLYGGGNNGLMGVLSETIHKSGGRIIGVIPRSLKDLGYGYNKTDEMIVTDGIRERKAIMEERADAFIGLPGGFGTLEEMIEIITLKQLAMHDKPIVILNVNNFYNGLLMQFEKGFEELFINEKCSKLYHVTDSVSETLDYIEEYRRVR